MTAEQLRKSILQYAIQGKLVPQIETEEPASELLKKIKVEKEKLIEEGKLKKEKPLPEITEDEIPFEIPFSWEWVRLNTIYRFIDYRGSTPNKINTGEIPLITAKNVKKGYLDFTIKDYITKVEYEKRKSRGISKKGDILFTTEAPMGNVALSNIEEYSAGQRLITFQQYTTNQFLFNDLYVYFLLSEFFQLQLKDKETGCTAKGIKADKLKCFFIPLPPLEEQKRIVKCIEQLMAMVDEYEKYEKELDTLEKEFPDKVKKSILQYAVQGKLVPQIDTEEPASELLKQIKAEKEKMIKESKIKKEKPLPEITRNEIPFEIPNSWEWVRLPQITYFQEGPGIMAIDFREDGIPLIRISGVKNKKVTLLGCNFLDKEMVENKWKHFKLDKDDIVISTSASMGNLAIVDVEAEGAIFYTGLIRFKPYGMFNNKFLIYFILSELYISQINEQKTGVAIQHYGPTHLKNIMVPVPSFAEQQRIVERIEQIFAIIDKM